MNFIFCFIKRFLLFFFFLQLFQKNVFANNILYLEDNFFPEGITISKKGDIFVGSLKENKIVVFRNKERKHKNVYYSLFLVGVMLLFFPKDKNPFFLLWNNK